MDDLAFALNPPFYGDHGGGENEATLFFKQFWQTVAGDYRAAREWPKWLRAGQGQGKGGKHRHRQDVLEQEDLSSKRHLALDSCFLACPDAKPVTTFAGDALNLR